MRSILLFIIIIVLWFALNRWILPMLGIQTWLSRICSLDEGPKIENDTKRGWR